MELASSNRAYDIYSCRSLHKQPRLLLQLPSLLSFHKVTVCTISISWTISRTENRENNVSEKPTIRCPIDVIHFIMRHFLVTSTFEGIHSVLKVCSVSWQLKSNNEKKKTLYTCRNYVIDFFGKIFKWLHVQYSKEVLQVKEIKNEFLENFYNQNWRTLISAMQLSM